MKKKLASVLLCAVMAASMLTGCGNSGDAAATTPATDGKTDVATTEAVETTAAADGSVYYLNFKPEVDEVWQKLAKEYTEETGVNPHIKKVYQVEVKYKQRYKYTGDDWTDWDKKTDTLYVYKSNGNWYVFPSSIF